MRKLKALAAAAAVAALAAGLHVESARAQMSEGVAAIVNDDIISTYDVRQRALLLLASSGVEANAENQQRARGQALRDLVDERLQIQEAREYDINVTQDAIDRSIAGIAQQNNLTADQFLAQLAASGINSTTLRRQIQADTAWRRLINGRYGSRVRISDGQVREMQQRIVESATRTQYQASEIFLPAATDAEFAEAEATAARLLQEMQGGAPFPLVARQFSAAPSAAAGGDLGWLAAGEFRPEVLAALDQMQRGQVSPPFRVANGVYIVALRARREGTQGSAEERVTLRQMTAPAASRSALQQARRRVTTCDALQTAAAGVEGAAIVDLGTANVTDLSEAVRTEIASLSTGQATAMTTAGETASFILVCARETNMSGLPSATDIENRLFEQELALLAQRHLRNLRREATIITR